MPTDESQIINALAAAWVWPAGWKDFDDTTRTDTPSTSARQVIFIREVSLASAPSQVLIHLTADTRYKLIINDTRVMIGPSRSDPTLWFYDSLDIAPFLRAGHNTIKVIVLRWFKSVRAGFPFVRGIKPGFALVGKVGEEDVGTLAEGWTAIVENGIRYPLGLVDDVFLHINERISDPLPSPSATKPVPYAIATLNGDLAAWRLHPRMIPLPAQSPVSVETIHKLDSSLSQEAWKSMLSAGKPITLPSQSQHTLEVQAECHSTAFLRLAFNSISTSSSSSRITIKMTYSEGYEHQPRQYPWLRTKSDRLDSSGLLLGPYDEVTLDVAGETVYEPFWFRTFLLLRLEITVGEGDVEMRGFEATQTNYPMDVRASWQMEDAYAERMWDISIRTLRNCMFDGYSDCPFYEQLQYAGDSRSVALFHYLLSGDDRLMRQAIVLFASSYTRMSVGGLTQSRFPSHVPQIIAGFPLFWILSICDHHLFFGDQAFVRSFLALMDGVFTWYDGHVDELGLVSGIEDEVWQYVDWVDTWSADPENGHPDKGVPTAGRKTNRHTYFSMLYAYTLKQAATLLQSLGRMGLKDEYESRAASVLTAVRKHCYDSETGFFTDSTVDVSRAHHLPTTSQHCQVFAVLSGCADDLDTADLLSRTFKDPKLGKCSYVMMFYAFRAISSTGGELYDQLFPGLMAPWRRMIDQNMTTWEEDDVRQRSDCHAWGAVPVYEFATEIAGLKPLGPAWCAVSWEPRVNLTDRLDAEICMGKDNMGTVTWRKEAGSHVIRARLRLDKEAQVYTRIPGGQLADHGRTSFLEVDIPV